MNEENNNNTEIKFYVNNNIVPIINILTQKTKSTLIKSKEIQKNLKLNEKLEKYIIKQKNIIKDRNNDLNIIKELVYLKRKGKNNLIKSLNDYLLFLKNKQNNIDNNLDKIYEKELYINYKEYIINKILKKTNLDENNISSNCINISTNSLIKYNLQDLQDNLFDNKNIEKISNKNNKINNNNKNFIIQKSNGLNGLDKPNYLFNNDNKNNNDYNNKNYIENNKKEKDLNINESSSNSLNNNYNNFNMNNIIKKPKQKKKKSKTKKIENYQNNNQNEFSESNNKINNSNSFIKFSKEQKNILEQKFLNDEEFEKILGSYKNNIEKDFKNNLIIDNSELDNNININDTLINTNNNQNQINHKNISNGMPSPNHN